MNEDRQTNKHKQTTDWQINKKTDIFIDRQTERTASQTNANKTIDR